MTVDDEATQAVEILRTKRAQMKQAQARYRAKRKEGGNKQLLFWITPVNLNWLDYWVGLTGTTVEDTVNQALRLAARYPDLLRALDSNSIVEEPVTEIYRNFDRAAEPPVACGGNSSV